jgi:hypothetical protein
MRPWRRFLLAIVLLAPSVAFAQGRVLRLAERWEDLTHDQQERALQNYRHYRELPPEKRKDVERRYERWKNLPSGDKDRYRRKFQDYRGRGIIQDD